MGEVFFYHLMATPLEWVLPALLARALAQRWRVEVRGTDGSRLEWLDQALWLGAEDGFVPHGLQGGPHDALQPVLLTLGPVTGAFDCLMAIDGAEVGAEQARTLSRACILFDGQDEAAKARARDQWRVLTGAGLGAKYWTQEQGTWVMKQERRA